MAEETDGAPSAVPENSADGDNGLGDLLAEESGGTELPGGSSGSESGQGTDANLPTGDAASGGSDAANGDGNPDGDVDTPPVGDQETEALESVLSQFNPKAQEAIQKRIGKLTAQKKTAEEENEDLRAELEKLRQGVPAESPGAGLEEFSTEESLAGYEAQASDLYDELADIEPEDYREPDDGGEPVVEVNGRKCTRAEVKALKTTLRKTLKVGIPARRKQLEGKRAFADERAQAEHQASLLFPGYNDPESADGQWLHAALENPKWKTLLENYADAPVLLGLLREGSKALQARTTQRKKSDDSPSPPSLGGGTPNTDELMETMLSGEALPDESVDEITSELLG